MNRAYLHFTVRCASSLIAVVSLIVSAAFAQEPATDVGAIAALEKTVVDTIARAENSVAAIARIRKDEAEARGGILGSDGSPTGSDFVPHEYGCGVVIDKNGLILTTYDVLGEIGASDYYVWLKRRPYLAKVKAADPWLNIAVLKIEAVDLTPIILGDAKKARRGQFVITLGNPQGIARDGEPSAAWGIVSNLSRPAPPAPRSRTAGGRETLHHYGTLIQVDAGRSSAGSGAALMNLSGEMIGLTTSLVGLSGQDQAAGFAIPIDSDFKKALDVMKSGKAAEFGFLGVAPRALSAELRRQGKTGAVVENVVPGTPAAKAGLRVDDLLLRVGDEPILDDLHLIRLLSAQAVETPVSLSFQREGSTKTQTVSITLSKKLQDASREVVSEEPPPRWRGLRVDYATAVPAFREWSRHIDPEGCVGIVEVSRDSAAWKAGLRPGRFISHVGDVRVVTPQAFYDSVAERTGDVRLRLTAAAEGEAAHVVAAE